MLCLGVFTLNAQENELPAAEEVKTANKEADKKDAKKLREEKKIEAADRKSVGRERVC